MHFFDRMNFACVHSNVKWHVTGRNNTPDGPMKKVKVVFIFSYINFFKKCVKPCKINQFRNIILIYNDFEELNRINTYCIAYKMLKIYLILYTLYLILYTLYLGFFERIRLALSIEYSSLYIIYQIRMLPKGVQKILLLEFSFEIRPAE